eukprot:499815_1
MKNAAQKGMLFPIVGLGTKGPGYKLGQQQECWYWPTPCCTNDYCPTVNATRDFITLANSKGLVARIDTGYPYGDNANNSSGHNGCPSDFYYNSNRLHGLNGGHYSCNTMGIGKGIKESKAKRSDVFVTIKTGYAGPMGNTDTQIKSTLQLMKLDYADLCLVHLPEVGPGTGGHGEYGDYHCNSAKSDYNAKECRVNTYASLVNESFKAGRCRAVGVNNWNASDVKELEDVGLLLPSVVQYKFHLHQSLASPWQKDLMDYCEEKGIIFNGIAPLGTPDWVTFTGDGMTQTALEEPKVHDIATKVGKSPAQVLQRWIVQQNIAIQTRSMDQDHMKENLDVFDWVLADEDMQTLSSFPQCSVQRGNPYMDGDPNGGQHHGNVIGMTQHC